LGTPETFTFNIGQTATIPSRFIDAPNNLYQWQSYNPANGTWGIIGVFQNILQIPNVTAMADNLRHRCQVMNPAFPVLTLTSAVKTLNVLTDLDILTAFYNYNGGPNWTTQTNWNSTNPAWYGVTFDGNGKVTEISLSNNNITGPLYPGLSSLSELTIIDLGGNRLTGPFPEQWVNMQKLTTLYLEYNEITGSIPDSWGNMISLEVIRLYNNSLTGVPNSLSTIQTLRYCDLSYNQLSDIPNFGPVLSQPGEALYVDHNKLEFDDLQKQIPRPSTFYYSYQAPVNQMLTLNVVEGQPAEFSVTTPGTQLIYYWYGAGFVGPPNGDFIGQNTATLHITAMKPYMAEVYNCSVTNAALPGLTLQRSIVQVNFIPAGLDNQMPDWYITLFQSSNQMRNKIMIPAFDESGLASLKVYDETSTTGEFTALSPSITLTGSATGYSFTDTGSDPSTRTYTYKISVLDGSGNESSLSDSQTSVHLVINLGLNNSRNLLWTPYEGLPVENYEIMAGNSLVLAEMSSLAMLPSHLNSYTDHGTYLYYVVITHLTGYPDLLKGGSLMQSVSNIFATNGLPEGPGEFDLLIYPNPARNQVNLRFSNPDNAPYTLTVFDLTGKEWIQQVNISSGEFAFQRGQIPAGVYYIRLVGENVFTGKVVLE